MKRKNVSKDPKVKDDDDLDLSEDDEDQNDKKSRKKKNGSKINWMALFFLSLFIVPGIIAGVIFVIDYMYPSAAIDRRIKQRVVNCYNVANPKKLSEVDRLIAKYKGNEYRLFAQLREKYEKYPECQ